MALADLFTQSNGGRAPQRTYLTGESMGGHVTLLGMQEFPTAFAGGLAMCPAGPELFDYFAAMSAAAEVVTGLQFHADTMQQDAAKMAELLGKPPDYTEKGRQLASIQVQMSGGPRPFAAEGLASRVPREHGDEPGGARRQHDADQPRRRHGAHQIRDRGRAGPDRRRDQLARPPQDRRRRDARRERPRTKRSCRSTARSSGRW